MFFTIYLIKNVRRKPMLRELKIRTLSANLQLKSRNLDSFGYGNVSVIDRESGLIVVRPACADYDQLSIDDMLLIDLMGNIVEGKGEPTDDVKIHIELYRNFAELDSLALIRSPFVTAFAQAIFPFTEHCTPTFSAATFLAQDFLTNTTMPKITNRIWHVRSWTK